MHTKKASHGPPSLRPFTLPQNIPRQTACALEGSLATGQKCLLVTCYLPHDLAEHAAACIAISTLTTTYPNHIIIIGGDFQGDLTSSSDKSCHLRTLQFTLFDGPHLHTFTPPHQPAQATCIEHFLYYQPLHNNIQTQDIYNILHAFLDHEGIKAKVYLPLKHHIQLSTPKPTKDTSSFQPLRFHFPIPRPLLTQWKETMRSNINLQTPLIQQNLNTLLSTLHTPDLNTQAARLTIDSNTRQQLMNTADALQDLLAEGLSIATKSFPRRPHTQDPHTKT